MDDEILQKLDSIAKRLSDVEEKLGAAKPSDKPVEKPDDTPLPQNPAFWEGSLPPPPPPPYIAGVPNESFPETPYIAKVASEEPRNLESYIGRWILGLVGVIAVVLGASFFLKYAFENNLIPPAGRVALGVLGGMIFILVGEFFRGRYRQYASILTGGGLGLLYLSTYGAFHYYDLISSGAAFGFMSAITGFGLVLAIWADAIELSLLASGVGYFTPYLLSTGVPDDFGFFGYLMVLNIGILSVAFFKKWHALTLLGFVGTILNFASWYGFYYESEKLAFTLYILGIFYATFALAGVVAPIVSRKKSDLGDLFILTVNAAWFFGWYYYLLYPAHEVALGFLAAGLGAVYILAAYFSLVLNPEDKNFVMFSGGLAVLFLTLAVPLALEQNAITIAWAVEAVVLFFAGLFLKQERLRQFSYVILAFALGRLFFIDSGHGDLSSFLPIFNKRFFTYLMTTASVSLMGYLAWKNLETFNVQEKGSVLPVLGSLLNILVLVAITLEIFGFFDAQLFEMNKKANQKSARETPVALNQPYNLGHYNYSSDYRVSYQNKLGFGAIPRNEYRAVVQQRNVTVSVFWTFWAILLISVGIVYRNAFLRWSALILFGITAAKVFLVDMAGVETIYRVISSTVLGILLLAASYLYFRYQKQLEQTENGLG